MTPQSALLQRRPPTPEPLSQEPTLQIASQANLNYGILFRSPNLYKSEGAEKI